MRYSVRALGKDGVITLSIDATDAQAAQDQAATRALRPLSVSPALGWPSFQRRSFSLPLFSQELLALLEAGLSLMESIAALHEKEQRDDARQVLTQLVSTLQDGMSFSRALEAQPETFPPLYIGLMRAAERTSNLPQSLGRYIDYRARLDTLRSRVISALIYPAILTIVGFLVTVFLLGHVVPRFAGVYQGTGRELPWLSAQLIQWGQFASTHGPLLLALAAGTMLLIIVGVRTWWQGGGLPALIRRLPGIGETVVVLELTRLYLALGTLLDGGLPIRQAMQLCEGLLTPATLNLYQQATTAITRGERLSDSFAAHGLSTPVAVRMLRVGERTGHLGDMMGRAARFHDGEIARRIDVFARTFEPVLMAAIGFVVGTIVVLLYMPIFDLAGSLR